MMGFLDSSKLDVQAAPRPPTPAPPGRTVLWFLVHLAVAALVVWLGRVALHFDKVTSFGFTPEYMHIAEGIVETGRYVARLADNIVVDAVYREPLYPYALAYCLKHGIDFHALIWVQRACLAVALAAWGLFCQRRLGALAALGFYALVLLSVIPHFYTSLLYPYAFQFLFITLGSLAFVQAVERRNGAYALVAGACLGAACYERAAYLLLAPFLVSVLVLLSRRVRFSWTVAVFLMLASAAVMAPWLRHNAHYGVRGMHQRMGYQLGFTYGHLLTEPRTELEQKYRDALAQFENDFDTYDANDQGTFRFMIREVVQNHLTYAEADRLVAEIMRPVLARHPAAVAKNVLSNVIYFPSRLAGMELGRFRPDTYGWSAMRFYLRYAQRFVPTAADYVLLVLALVASCRLFRSQPVLVATALALSLYTLGIVGGIGTLDPRYRGAGDAMLYMLAAYEMARWVRPRRAPSAS